MNTPSELSRKAREKLMRRQEILEAAKRIFAEKGFEKATLDEIAVAAEFGKGTIYNYFSSKEELFLNLFEQGRENFRQFVRESMAEGQNALEKLERYISACFKYFKEHKNLFQILSFEIHQPIALAGQIHEKLNADLQDDLHFLGELIKEGIEQKLIVPLDPVRLARALQGLIHSQVCCALSAGLPEDEKNAEIVKQVFLHGITRPRVKTAK